MSDDNDIMAIGCATGCLIAILALDCSLGRSRCATVEGGTRMTVKEMAERTTILRVPAGSNLHGLNVPGHDDTDEIGVCVEDVECAIGFAEFEQYIYRTAAERSGKNDEPSQHGDLDLTIFSLRKFLRLAMQGNPQIIQSLYGAYPSMHTSN